VIVAPSEGLFRLDTNNTIIVVLKSGLYHIFGASTQTSGTQAGSVMINGTSVWYSHVYTNTYDCHPFTLVRKLNQNDKIQIYLQNLHQTQQTNTITVQRIGD